MGLKKRHLLWSFECICFISLAVSAFAARQECADQNIFFPLSSGNTWKYRVILTDEGKKDIFNLTRRFVAASIPYKTAQIAGELIEKLDVCGGNFSNRTPIKVVNGAVFEGPFHYRATGPEGFDWNAMIGQGGFQLFLPEMKSLHVGTSWSRSGGLIVTEKISKSRATGSVSQSDQARVIGTEEIVLEAGKFETLKVESVISGFLTGIGGGTDRMTQWFAPMVGLVKMSSADGEYKQELLSADVTPCCGFMVTKVDGKADVDGKPAEPGMGFSGSSKISVQQGGSMEFSMGNGIEVKASGVSDFAVQTYCDELDKARDRTIFDIIKGNILFHVGKFFRLGEFKFRFPTGGGGVRGTKFSVKVYEENGRSLTLIEVFEGSVWVQKKGKTEKIILTAGEKGKF